MHKKIYSGSGKNMGLSYFKSQIRYSTKDRQAKTFENLKKSVKSQTKVFTKKIIKKKAKKAKKKNL